ncbi:MAG: hypothetical protein K2K91_04640 [Ruminococcus sp.]|nr:hypothetical protein [Ruminococcus sp.]
MKKQFFLKLYSALFIGICAVPLVCMPFVKADSSAEKKTPVEFPSVMTEDKKINFDYFSQLDNWFSENFAFRQQFVNADSRIRTSLTKTSPNYDVIQGSDGWLYYGETTDDYLNINTLSQREINNIAHNLRMIDEYCKENGAEFVFFSAPDKNSVYPENMPFNYVPSDNKNNYALLSEELADDSFFLDMKTALLETDSSIPLYHKTDTHWNNLGAYAGHVAIMNRLGLTSCSITGWYTKNNHLGDLAEMIYPTEKPKDTQVYSDYEFSYTYQGLFRGLMDVTINTTNENAEGNLLMFRDSFGSAILQYMAESFNSAEFSRVVPYRINNIENRTVVLEIVERNLGNLQKYAPIMPAPVEDISGLSPEIYSGGDEIIEIEESGLFMHIYGLLPEKYFSGDKHTIYIEADGIIYKAFNCFEDELLKREGEHNGNGFSLYVPTNTNTENIKVTVVNSDGKTVASH